MNSAALGVALACCVRASAGQADEQAELVQFTIANVASFQKVRQRFIARGEQGVPLLLSGLSNASLGAEAHARILGILGELRLESTETAILARYYSALDNNERMVTIAAMTSLSTFPSFRSGVARDAIDIARYQSDMDIVRHAVVLLLEGSFTVYVQKPRRGQLAPRHIATNVSVAQTATWSTVQVLVDLLADERYSWRAEAILTELSQNPEEEELVAVFASRPSSWFAASGTTAKQRWLQWLSIHGASLQSYVARQHCTLPLYSIVNVGDLRLWRGIAPGCPLESAMWRNRRSGTKGVGTFFDSAYEFQRFHATDFAPQGFTVWLQDNHMMVVQIDKPLLPTWLEPIERTIGRPTDIMSDGIRGHQHWLYPARGLILHVERESNDIVAITLVRRATLEEMRRMPWLHDTSTREPRLLSR